MIVTVFRSRLKPGVAQEYEEWGERMDTLVRQMPGFVSAKDFVAEDGERLAVIEFESAAALRAWSQHPEHRAAKDKGRRDFYAEYRIQVCTVERNGAFPDRRER